MSEPPESDRQRTAEPLVSVIMPVRNGEAFMIAALDCVLGQTWKHLEVIVIDDHSTDATASLLATVGDPRLRVLDAPDNGLVAALVHGTSIAQGEYLARMDADDHCEPDRLSRQVAFMLAHENVVVVGSSFEVVDGSGRHVRFEPALCDDDDLRRELYVRNPLGHGTTMIRAGALRAAGGYRSTFGHAEDYDLWVRMAGVGSLAALPEPMYRWRRHAASASARHSHEQTASTGRIRAELWVSPPTVLNPEDLGRRIKRYRAEKACDGELADRFIQVQIAIVCGAARRRQWSVAGSQIIALLRCDRAVRLAVIWFALTGGRYVSGGSLLRRIRVGRRT